jgi:hypothetical protein
MSLDTGETYVGEWVSVNCCADHTDAQSSQDGPCLSDLQLLAEKWMRIHPQLAIGTRLFRRCPTPQTVKGAEACFDTLYSFGACFWLGFAADVDVIH